MLQCCHSPPSDSSSAVLQQIVAGVQCSQCSAAILCLHASQCSFPGLLPKPLVLSAFFLPPAFLHLVSDRHLHCCRSPWFYRHFFFASAPLLRQTPVSSRWHFFSSVKHLFSSAGTSALSGASLPLSPPSVGAVFFPTVASFCYRCFFLCQCPSNQSALLLHQLLQLPEPLFSHRRPYALPAPLYSIGQCIFLFTDASLFCRWHCTMLCSCCSSFLDRS